MSRMSEISQDGTVGTDFALGQASGQTCPGTSQIPQSICLKLLYWPLLKWDTLRVPRMVMNFSSSVPHFSSPAWNNACNKPPWWAPCPILNTRLMGYMQSTEMTQEFVFPMLAGISLFWERCCVLGNLLSPHCWTLIYRLESNSMRSCLVFCFAHPIAADMFIAHGIKVNSIFPLYICALSKVSYRAPCTQPHTRHSMLKRCGLGSWKGLNRYSRHNLSTISTFGMKTYKCPPKFTHTSLQNLYVSIMGSETTWDGANLHSVIELHPLSYCFH